MERMKHSGSFGDSQVGSFIRGFAFWGLSVIQDDNLLPGFRFKVPMMITLDTLRSDDTVIKRIGETWMRCSLKSYLRWVGCCGAL